MRPAQPARERRTASGVFTIPAPTSKVAYAPSGRLSSREPVGAGRCFIIVHDHAQHRFVARRDERGLERAVGYAERRRRGLRLLGDLEGADSLYRQSLAIRRVLFGDEHPAVLRVINNLGGLYLRAGDYAAAERSFREVIAARRRRPGEVLDLAVPLNNLGAALSRQGKHREGIVALREAMQMYAAQVGDDHPSLAFMLTTLGTAYRAVGDGAAAERSYLRALELRRKHLSPGHPLLIVTLGGLARLRIDEGNPAEAERLYREALEITRASKPDDSVGIAEAESDLASALIELARLDEAEALLLAAYPVLQSGAGAEDPRTVRVLERLVRLYEGGGRADAAARFRALLPQGG